MLLAVGVSDSAVEMAAVRAALARVAEQMCSLVASASNSGVTAALIPAEGEPLIVTPEFEEPSIRESLAIRAEVRVWNEHQSPFALLADWLKARGADAGPVGVEETVRFFAVEGLRALKIETRGDAGVVRACRVIKSATEIALLQAASDITIVVCTSR